jgi:predicted DCC family thiol-disulfide oxidoreductase YuxK
MPTERNDRPANEGFSYRRDPAVPAFDDDHPVIVFDGKCALCSGFVRFILNVDRRRRFRLLAAQSATGSALYRHFGLSPTEYDTFILIENGHAWLKSDGAIRIFGQLGFPWSLISIGRLIPLALRDRIYDFVAQNRLRWFGAREVCYVPDAAEADRFLQ